ncbi:P1 family peptidase [Actinokineospora bangkokensis]|uniref:P1 family peptidase n=1 Tax=Actinokineospora bangkokensis TaxID=1193682 RepID=UPI000B1AB58E|nr:P1 family peptidase [Actinokineospora bangkokensis]
MTVLVGRSGGAVVVLLPEGSVGGADARGGPAGTREVEVLAPENLVARVDAVCVGSGGPAGLAAADGVMRWLRERDRGFRVGDDPGQVVPIVPAATDPGGEVASAEAGHLACEAAEPVPEGSWVAVGDHRVQAVPAGAVAVVVTDAPLDKAQCRRLAISARDGAVRAAGAGGLGAFTVFTAATGQAAAPVGPAALDRLCGAAADAVAGAWGGASRP